MTRLRACGASATHARLPLFLLVAALGLAAQPAAAQTEVIEYYGHDALGSIRIVFNASGVATARADYEPFGEAVTIAGMPTGPLPAQQFTGQERDGLESQDYFGARYYRPRHGRFSQVDPVYAGLFDPQQWNRYAYARNNPLSFVDPTGEYTRDANSPGGYSCAEILKDNPGDALCNPFHAALTNPTTQLEGGVRTDAIAFRVGGEDKRGGGDRSKKNVTITVSLAGGVVVGGEAGLLFVVDSEQNTLTEYGYVGLGTGPGLQPFGGVFSGATMNLEVGLVDAERDLSGSGWQFSAFAAVGAKGATFNVITTLSFELIGFAGGWSGGIGAGAGMMFTRTWLRQIHGLSKPPDRILRLLQGASPRG